MYSARSVRKLSLPPPHTDHFNLLKKKQNILQTFYFYLNLNLYHISESLEVAGSDLLASVGGEWGRATPLNPPLLSTPSV